MYEIKGKCAIFDIFSLLLSRLRFNLEALSFSFGDFSACIINSVGKPYRVVIMLNPDKFVAVTGVYKLALRKARGKKGIATMQVEMHRIQTLESYLPIFCSLSTDHNTSKNQRGNSDENFGTHWSH